MANRINYTDKVALNARTEIAEINKHTAANDNEIKNVVNAHATNIEILEANQTSGVIRADTIVDEGDGRSFLPVTGDTSTAYIVDGETAPDEAKNGNYEWDGAAYTKTAYQTVAGSKTDLATNGSQDVFTSQGAFDLDADLQSQIDSNDVEIAQNISDIAQNTLDITQNESDIADNQTRSTDTENILLVGSDAYTHAERGVSDGFTTERLVQLDNEIEANLDADFYFKAGHSKGDGIIGIAVPDVSAADLSLDRNSNATFVNKRGVIETALPNVPRFDWSSGEPALLTEPQAENLINYSEDFTQWSRRIGGTATLAVVTQNYANDPSGGNNATRIQFELNGGTTTNDKTTVYKTYTPTNTNVNHTTSCWLKSNNGSTKTIILSGNSGSDTVTVDGIWRRYDTTRITTPSPLRELRIGLRGSFGTSDSADVLLWGAQIEEGDKATSNIPTNGATAVRLADTGIETGDVSQYIDSTQGSFEVEFKSDFVGIDRSFSISDGTDNNKAEIRVKSDEDLIVTYRVNGDSNIIYSYVGSFNASQYNKVRFVYSNEFFEVFVNDVSVDSQSSGNTESNKFEKINLNRGQSSFPFLGQTKSIKIS